MGLPVPRRGRANGARILDVDTEQTPGDADGVLTVETVEE